MHIRWLCCFLFILAIVASCGDDDPLDAAWDLYTQGNYEEAITEFEASGEDAGSQMGIGWCHLRLGNMSAADAAFAQAEELNGGLAGWAIAKWGLEDYAGCIEKGEDLMDRKPTFSFSRDRTINFRDIRWHMAESYLQEADLANAISNIQILDPGFSANTDDPDIEQTLLAKLEELAMTLGKGGVL